METGKEPIGLVDVGQGRAYARKVLKEQLEDVYEQHAEETSLKNRLCCLTEEEKLLCAATPWNQESSGWRKVECILDSGAAESVCPPTMAPSWPICDSVGSRAGLHYTAAGGARIPNRGEQHLPILFENGAKSFCVFQVAEVARPLVSVAKVTERGNAVLFGVGGGVIRNLQTGADTPFYLRDGVYVFSILIPPASAVESCGSDFARQP